MPATAYVPLLSALETGASSHDSLQAGADRLAAAIWKQLLQYLGPLQDMLNHDERRQVFVSIPFGLLRVSYKLSQYVGASPFIEPQMFRHHPLRRRRTAFLRTRMWIPTPRPQVVAAAAAPADAANMSLSMCHSALLSLANPCSAGGLCLLGRAEH